MNPGDHETFLDRTGRLAGVGGWEVDLVAQTIYWSDQTCRMHEVEPGHRPTLEEALGYYPPEAREAVRAALARAIGEGTPFDFELPMDTARGRRIQVRAVGEVGFEGGRAVRIFGAVQDVTRRHDAETQLRQEQVQRAEIERQAAQLNALLAERSEMLDVLAHEVRQPLNNASAALQSAAAALADPASRADAAERLQRAQGVMHAVLAGVDNTLAAAALLGRGAPTATLDPEADIDTLLAVAIGDMPGAERARVRIERAASTRTAAMDVGLTRLALRNLLANALRHSPPRAEVVLRVADSDQPLALVLEVIDRGPGIAEALRPRLFERGARGRDRSGRASHGLGLYIVRRALELQGGRAELAHTGPDGTRMRLWLAQANDSGARNT